VTPFNISQRNSYWRPLVIMALSCTIYKTKRYIGRKLRYFHTPPIFGAPVSGPHRRFAIRFGMEKLEWCGYPMLKKSLRICLAVSTPCRRVTDGLADRHILRQHSSRRRIARYKLVWSIELCRHQWPRSTFEIDSAIFCVKISVLYVEANILHSEINCVYWE